MPMHRLQAKILRLAEQIDISKLSLRQLGGLIGEQHAQNVSYHRDQLIRQGLLSRNLKPTAKVGGDDGRAHLAAIPIVGSANCGPAELLAQENIEGHLWVSPKLINPRRRNKLIAVHAVGDSMNAAKQVPGGPIDEGDFVIVDYTNRSPENGDYVLSVIDDAANIKRFYQDPETKEVSLVSESTTQAPPIFIHPEDNWDYMVNGVVERVLKKRF